MNSRKMLSALLAAVMVFTLTCTPAFAAKPNEVLDMVRTGIWMDGAELRKEMITVDLQDWVNSRDAGDYGGYIGEKAGPMDYSVYKLPLGVKLVAGPDNFRTQHIAAYSDPDGDGVYERRISKNSKMSGECAIQPLPQTGPFIQDIKSLFTYGNEFSWGYGNDQVTYQAPNYTGRYCITTTDLFVDLFGPNTLLVMDDLEENSEPICLLLTGEERPEGMAYDRLEDYGIYLTTGGHIASQWAVETVDAALDAGMIPESVEISHVFDMRGEITRGEFAAVAVRLYSEMYQKMTGEWADYDVPDESPFVDVQETESMAGNYGAILAAYTLGIVNGTSTVNKTFSPDKLVSRQEAATMLARVYTKLGGTLPTVANTSFSDDADIAAYAKNAVSFMSAHEIVNGVGGNRFNPKGSASVEQALKIALEMLNNLKV